MTVKEYIQHRFGSFGYDMSEADVLDITLPAGLTGDEAVNEATHARVSVAIARYIPTLLLRAQTIREGDFQLSWDVSGIRAYYAHLCRKYGIADELNPDKPKVRFIQ